MIFSSSSVNGNISFFLQLTRGKPQASSAAFVKGNLIFVKFLNFVPSAPLKSESEASCKYYNESTQAESFISQTCTKTFVEFGKFWETTMRASLMRYILNKIAGMQYLCQNQIIPLTLSCNLTMLSKVFPGRNMSQNLSHKIILY